MAAAEIIQVQQVAAVVVAMMVGYLERELALHIKVLMVEPALMGAHRMREAEEEQVQLEPDQQVERGLPAH